MAPVGRGNDDNAMPDFVILAGVVVAFVGTLSAVLWGIATGTGGDAEDPTQLPR